ncbi:MAG: hypothetical protein UU10_C0004G0019 [Parcubacteria group bacterium GW2011_GWF1_40_6]|uniref:Chloroplast import component protein (Tic20) n=2 Tax=Candidatus Nomuraibacteriota TaxID=1752729 RepID=A0A0G0R102_9BACT|nr:MAG: hypothetical protein UT78_C0004G0021 [Candidatus Nomurabacteria bacterium GW2011_GWF2_40_12]KKR69848.1 MAG: hypothetical protein UU10_C0004G0019 [Parcubacteria group bacterium GW2011_GWF1_40_6]
MDPNNKSEGAETNAGALSKKDNKTIMGILSYLGPLVIVSYLAAKDDPFVKFHIKQGLVLIVIEIIAWLISSMFWRFFMFMNFVNFAVLVFAVIGILNVTQGKEKELPLIGQFSRYFSF